MSFLAWLEQTAISVWVRESPTLWAFPFVLFLHTLGLGIAAGFSIAVNVWVATLGQRYPRVPLAPFFSTIWIGFTVALVSGILLLIAYPTKALTDPVFYLKLVLIAAALVQIERLRRRASGIERSAGRDAPPSAVPHMWLSPRASACIAIFLWLGAVATGRFLAYTYNYLTAADLLMAR